MDEDQVSDVLPVGEQLRAAREAMGLPIEDVASSTRVPMRHLAALEQGDWSKLPAPTYTLGFAKAYAGAVGLDRNAIAEQLRAEMGGYDPNPYSGAGPFEPIDPKRAMPKWLIFVGLAAAAALVLMFTLISNRAVSGGGNDVTNLGTNAVAVPAYPTVPPADTNVATSGGLNMADSGAANNTNAAAPTVAAAKPEPRPVRQSAPASPRDAAPAKTNQPGNVSINGVAPQ